MERSIRSKAHNEYNDLDCILSKIDRDAPVEGCCVCASEYTYDEDILETLENSRKAQTALHSFISSMAGSPNMLNMLAEKVVQPAINPEHLAYCPTMDLIASATVDDQVSVYRLNGQKVFGVSSKSGPGKITGIRWKPNGRNAQPGPALAHLP